MTTSVDTWPFTGRDDELLAAATALDRRGCLVIAGPAGVGKSRLARELLARAGRAGSGHGFVAATTSSRDIPLAALAGWTGPPAGAGPDVTAVQRATATLRAGGPGWVLGVDDAHLLDAVSATVLQHLAAERAISLVLTLRTGQSAPDAITALWKDGAAERLDLPPLTGPPTGALLRAVLGGPVDPASEQRFFEVTRGNVLWLRHLVDGERRAGRLARWDGLWRWAGPAGLPPALAELVAEQIGVLTEAQARVLELLSFGEPLGLDQLGRLAGPDAVEEVAQRGLAAVRREGARWEVRVAHPLYAEAVRARVNAPRARRLRGELADVFVAGQRAGDGLRAAVLALDSDRRPDPAVLVRAAEQAVGLSDHVLGERLFRAAGEAGAGFEARLGLAGVLSWMVRPAEAAAALAAARRSARTDAERLRAALFSALLLFFDDEDPAAAAALLDRAQAAVGTARAGTVLDAMRAVLATAAGDVDRGARLAGGVLAARGSPPEAAAWASWAASYARACSGRGAPVSDLVRAGVGAARAGLETLPLQNNIAFAEVIGVCLEGEPARAGPRTAWVRRQPGGHAAGFSAMLEAYPELTRGHPRSAIRLVHEVLPQLPGKGGGWTAFLAALLAHAHGLLGEADAAREALRLADRTAHAAIAFFDPQVDLARAWAALAAGATTEARGHLARAADRARASGQSAVEVLVRHTRVCVGDRTQVPRLAALAGRLGSPAATAAAAHARALATGDPGALLAVSAELAAAQRFLVAADAAAQAAVLARAGGRLAEAAAAAARAAELAQRCEGARTPALAAADSPLPLRDREREIALLAADGLTNRAIADRLQLSVRTVESHVYRACSRLGLADRAELVAAVRPGARVRGHGR